MNAADPTEQWVAQVASPLHLDVWTHNKRYENSFSTSFLAALLAFRREKAKPARKRPPTTDKPKAM
jgi:hypothetical protein